ncbi:hypothetical protein FACS1894126_6260 [Alphaproteobacteria bacterium]|nr:hypothetical protein FACS1894126_6260 [Alphaproteobacteria bacterium]
MVPQKNVSASKARYGYVMKDGKWVPAASSVEAITAAVDVANGASTGALSGPEINAALDDLQKAAEKKLVLDSRGNLTSKDTFNDPSTQFGYVKDSKGATMAASSPIEAASAAVNVANDNLKKKIAEIMAENGISEDPTKAAAFRKRCFSINDL